MRRGRPQELFCWVIDPDESPIPLEEDERPTDAPALRLGSSEPDDNASVELPMLGEGVRASETPSRDASPGERSSTPRQFKGALAAACVFAFVIGWSLAAPDNSRARPVTKPTGDTTWRDEALGETDMSGEGIGGMARTEGART